MGLVRMGPPRELMLELKERYGFEDFIETGTYHGDTAAWAASHFDRVTTIEFSKEIYAETKANIGWIQNVNLVFGDSKEVLKAVVHLVKKPAIFWLDSHWSGGHTYGQGDECPLIGEIEAISVSEYSHFLFIDDARLFTSPPPEPHQIEQWPSIDVVLEKLQVMNHRHYIVIIDDVIVAVPEHAKALVAAYCQKINTEAWGKSGQLQRSTETKGRRLLSNVLRLLRLGC